MKNPAYSVRRRAFSRESGKITVLETNYAVKEESHLVEAIRQSPDLNEVRPREILEITVDENWISVAEVVRELLFVETDIPDDMPVGLSDDELLEVLGSEADDFSMDAWDQVTGSIVRRPIFINGRTFIPFRDELSTEAHFVESQTISEHEKPTPKFDHLVTLGFTEENSMVSGYYGDEVGLISDDVVIWIHTQDDYPDEIKVFRQQPSLHVDTVLEVMCSQMRPFMSKIMVEGLIGELPKFGDGVPEAWVEAGGSWTALTYLRLSPVLTSENPISEMRREIVGRLRNANNYPEFESWLVEYIDSILCVGSPLYNSRLGRQEGGTKDFLGA